MHRLAWYVVETCRSLASSNTLCADDFGGVRPLRLAVEVQANGEPPTRVSVAFGNSDEQLRGRNRRETNEPSDEFRCTSLSDFLVRVVKIQFCSLQWFDAATLVRMSSNPFLAHLYDEPESHSLMRTHQPSPGWSAQRPVTGVLRIDLMRT